MFVNTVFGGSIFFVLADDADFHERLRRSAYLAKVRVAGSNLVVRSTGTPCSTGSSCSAGEFSCFPGRWDKTRLLKYRDAVPMLRPCPREVDGS